MKFASRLGRARLRDWVWRVLGGLLFAAGFLVMAGGLSRGLTRSVHGKAELWVD